MRVERAARAELALGEGRHRARHVGVVRRAVGLEDPLAARGVGHRPALVLVIPESQARNVGIARGAEHGESVDPVEHPAAQAHPLQQQHARVARGGQLRGGLGQRILLDEGERERLTGVDQPAELRQRGDLVAVDVVVDRVPVLGEEAQDRDQVLGDVGHRYDEQRPGDVHTPGVVPLQVGLGGRQVQPPVSQLPDKPAVALGHQFGRHLTGGGVNERAGVPGREEVHPRVVGEEELGGVEAGRGGKRAPRRRTGIIRQMWRITGVPGDREVPAGRSAHRAEQEHPLKLAQRNRVVPGPVGKRPIRDLITEGEAPRAAAEQRLHQRKSAKFP